MLRHANSLSLFKQRWFAVMLAAASAASGVAAQPLLLLRAGTMDPRSMDRMPTDVADERSAAHLLVQFEAARAREVRAALLRTGATIEGYVPESAYRVRRVGVSADALRAIDGVTWVGSWRREWKIEPVLARAATQAPDVARTIEIFGFVDGSGSALRALVAKHLPDARIVAQSAGERLPRIALELRGDLPLALAALSASDEISWVNDYAAPQLDNTEAAGVIQGGTIAARSLWSRGINGTGQIVALADSGLDANESWFTRYNPGSGLQIFISAAQATTPPQVGVMHANAKVIGNWVQPGAVAYETLAPCGAVPAVQHGTHVAGSIAGDGFTTATPTSVNADPGDGMAPNAQLLMQDIGADCLVISDFAGTLKQAHAAGARIHNNSWGAANAGVYSGFDFDADDTTWLLQDLLVVASAGNRADNFNAVGSPGAAKNVLTVGALNHGESTQWAIFTSIGHSNGKPIKPDISAPGVDTVSADGDDQSVGPEEPAETRLLSGTSMASPTVAGGAALLRQYLVDGFYPRGARRALDRWRPLAATLKAVLMNGTTELLNDFVGETRLPSPITGWGRIFLERDLFFPGDARRHRIFERTHGTGIGHSETHTYSIAVAGTGESLRATLVWSDPAGLPGVDFPLVNDLDLRVIGPDGAVFLGNAFGDSQSRPGFLVESIADFGAPDRKHSVEAVRLLLPLVGTYTIEVKGFSVPGNDRVGSDRQGYSLVVAGALNLPTLAAIAPPPANVHVAGNDLAGVAVAFDPVANADAYQLYRAEGACKDVDLADFHLAGIDAAVAVVDPNTVGGDRYAYRVRAVVDDVEGDASACVDVVSADDCTLPPLADLAAPAIDAANATCSVALAWNAAPARCANSGAVSYRVERAESADFSSPVTIATDLPTLQFVDTAALPGRIYFYRTFAIDTFGNSSPPSAIGNATPVGEGGPAGLGFSDDADTASFVQLEPPWQVAAGAGVAGSNAYKTGASAAVYPALSCASVALAPLVVPDNAQLVYDARFQLENAWDGVVVEISADDGERWIDLAPDGGYPGSFAQTQDPPVNACGYPSTRAAFSGDNGTFTTYTSSLAAYAGQRVRIRWRLSSDPGLEFEGYRLDQIRIMSPGDELPSDLILRSGFGNDDAAAVGMSCQLPP